MATILTLPSTRFVAQVNTEAAEPKANYKALAERNAVALEDCVWHAAGEGVKASIVPHDFAKSFTDDAYDAFCMTGNYDASANTEIAYAGMVAYRFALPQDYLSVSSEANLLKMSLTLSRDRFLLPGLRVSAILSDSAVPSSSWAVVRGDAEGCVKLAAQLPNGADRLTAAEPATGAVEVELEGLDTTKKAYLWIYLTVEDYKATWAWYSSSQHRLYAIEGSGMVIAESSTVEFSADVTPDSATPSLATLLAGGSSPTWLEPPVMLDVGATAPEVPAGDAIRETFFAELPLESGYNSVRNSISVPYVFKFQSTTTSSTYQWTGSVKLDFNGASLESGTHDYVLANVSGQDSLTISDGTIAMWTNGDPATTQSSQYRTLSISCGVALNPTNGTMVVTVNLSPYLKGYLLTAEESSGLSFTSDALVYMPTSSESNALYLMLKAEDGVPVEADLSTSADESGRLHRLFEITPPGTGETHYTVDVGSYTGIEVWFDDSTSEVKASLSDMSWSWRSYADPSGSGYYFDAAATASRSAEATRYGMAAACADFTAAVATFEASPAPSNAEVLGRLVRMSKEQSGGMATLHPATAALTGELDAMRPLPRFLRGGTFSGAIGQPGLSAWYHRPSTGSTADFGYTVGANNATVSAGIVTNAAFLQLACLALRSPAELAERITLKNVGSSPVHCDLKLRFVAWRSPASLWDKSNSFALASLGSMPSIYSSEGAETVKWTVEMAGTLFPFAARQMSAQRVGVSNAVDAIAASASIDIPLTTPIGEGDVVIIAPEVIGFASSPSGDAYFGLASDPSKETPFVWARETYNIGWFPEVQGR